MTKPKSQPRLTKRETRARDEFIEKAPSDEFLDATFLLVFAIDEDFFVFRLLALDEGFRNRLTMALFFRAFFRVFFSFFDPPR